MKAEFLALVLAGATAAAAQVPVTSAQAIAEDAANYAVQYGVTPAEAARRLRAQQASVKETERIARDLAGRLAGIAIEHAPEFRVVVLLTGDEPVPPQVFRSAGLQVPILFRTGAKATHAAAVAAMRRHLIDFRSELPGSRGAGYDQRTGEVVLLVTSADAQRLGVDAIRRRAEEISGVAVRILINELLESNMAIAGGGRVDGLSAVTGKPNVCTTGFVVTDGEREGLATAAHCPDQLMYRDAADGDVTLPFVGQWGLGYHDVQVNVASQDLKPLFYSDRKKGTLRTLTSWRNRSSTRAGDYVCHWGESTGYSCAEVEFTDYAPPGTLCGGPCSPTWVTVRGPRCMTGDSGGPVFSGTVAFGIAKGINRNLSGQCNFYYYMSTDFLPAPWRLAVGSLSAK